MPNEISNTPPFTVLEDKLTAKVKELEAKCEAYDEAIEDFNILLEQGYLTAAKNRLNEERQRIKEMK